MEFGNWNHIEIYFIFHVQMLQRLSILVNINFYFQSISLSTTAFQCSWYTDKYSDIRKCLAIIIMKSQTPVSMNALGLFELSYASFLSVYLLTCFLEFFSHLITLHILGYEIHIFSIYFPRENGKIR